MVGYGCDGCWRHTSDRPTVGIVNSVYGSIFLYSYVVPIHSWHLTRQLNKKDLDLRTLSFRWFLCPKLYGSMCRWQHHFWHMNMGCCQKYHVLIPTYNHKFVWPYFTQIILIFPVLVFAYKLPSPSKVCHTNSYIKLEICMTILCWASCDWDRI